MTDLHTARLAVTGTAGEIIVVDQHLPGPDDTIVLVYRRILNTGRIDDQRRVDHIPAHRLRYTPNLDHLIGQPRILDPWRSLPTPELEAYPPLHVAEDQQIVDELRHRDTLR